MLEFTNGDMFERDFDIRVNTINCVGTAGAGVALAFKRRYPEMHKEYVDLCKLGKIKPGAMWVWKDDTFAGEVVVNFPTKRHWKENSRYEDIESGLQALKDYLDALGQDGVTVAIPALGCGHGNLDFKIVKKMIEKYLSDSRAKISVFTPWDSRNLGKKK